MLFPFHRHNKSRLCIESNIIANVFEFRPRTCKRFRISIFTLIWRPACAARSHQKIIFSALYNGRRFAVTTRPEREELFFYIEIIVGQFIENKIVVFAGSRKKIGSAIAVAVKRAVARHIIERTKTFHISKRFLNIVGPGHSSTRFVVVTAILIMHPHHILSGFLIVNYLGALNIGLVQLSMRIARKQMPPKLPVHKVFRTVARHKHTIATVFANPVIILTHFEHSAPVRVYHIAFSI